MTIGLVHHHREVQVPHARRRASASDIWKRNYRYVFGVYSIAETYFNGVIELAKKQGYKTMAILHEDTVFPTATAKGHRAQAQAKGMQVVLKESYPIRGDRRLLAADQDQGLNPDVVVGAPTSRIRC